MAYLDTTRLSPRAAASGSLRPVSDGLRLFGAVLLFVIVALGLGRIAPDLATGTAQDWHGNVAASQSLR